MVIVHGHFDFQYPDLKKNSMTYFSTFWGWLWASIPHWSLYCLIFQKNTVFNLAVSLKLSNTSWSTWLHLEAQPKLGAAQSTRWDLLPAPVSDLKSSSAWSPTLFLGVHWFLWQRHANRMKPTAETQKLSSWFDRLIWIICSCALLVATVNDHSIIKLQDFTTFLLKNKGF